MVNFALKGCRIAVVGQMPDANPQQIRGWIEHSSGKLSSAVDDYTTHVVIAEKSWRARGKIVESILARKANGQKIFLMKYDWLKKCCAEKRHVKEDKREYSWEREEQHLGDGKLGVKGNPKSTAGLMSQVFTESTEAYVDVRELQRQYAQQKAEEAAKKEEDEMRYRDWINQRNAMRRNEVAAVFRKGAQKAKQDLMTNNHHIYTDSTGFSYDVMLTKVDTRKNRNERFNLTIQIYESNSEFPTFAVTARFSGTGRTPTKNVIELIGSNFTTAMSRFRHIFAAKTGIDWDDRISAAVEQNKQNARAREYGTASPNRKRMGTPVNEPQTVCQEVSFDQAPFLYHPPKYGPRGELPVFQQPGPYPPQQAARDDGDFVRGSVVQQDGGDLHMTSGSNDEAPEPRHLSEAEYDRKMAELKRSVHDVVDEAYDQPHSFGLGLECKEQEQEAQYPTAQADEFDHSYLANQIPLDQEYFDHTQMAEHARGQFMDFVVEDDRKRKRCAEDQDSDPEKKAKSGSTELLRNARDGFASGEDPYTFDFGDESGDRESQPRGFGGELQDEADFGTLKVDLGLEDEVTV